MTRKREKLQAYFAGLFDGEGTVGVYFTGGVWRLSVGIHMIVPLPIGLLFQEYPEATFKKIDGAYRLNLYGETARRFLEEMKPYVVYKHEQIKLALSFLNYSSRYRADRRRKKLPMNAPYPAHFHRRAQQIADKMKEQKGTLGVNSVELWPSKSRQYRAKQDEAESDVKKIREHLEGVETRHSESVEATSAPEKDIVQV